MAKTSGLNTRIYVHGYDISGDASALSNVGYTSGLQATTSINQEATSRIIGLDSGTLGVSAFFESASEHAALLSSNVLPTTDRIVIVALGSAVGDAGIGFNSKQANYDVDAGGTGAPVTVSASFESTAVAPQFGAMLTAHDDTHSSASNGTSVDNSASSASGGTGYISAMSLTSGSPVVKIQHSTNDSSWADLITFSTSTAISAEYKEVTGTVNRYIRVISTGTFANLNFACVFYRG